MAKYELKSELLEHPDFVKWLKDKHKKDPKDINPIDELSFLYEFKVDMKDWSADEQRAFKGIEREVPEQKKNEVAQELYNKEYRELNYDERVRTSYTAFLREREDNPDLVKKNVDAMKNANSAMDRKEAKYPLDRNLLENNDFIQWLKQKYDKNPGDLTDIDMTPIMIEFKIDNDDFSDRELNEADEHARNVPAEIKENTAQNLYQKPYNNLEKKEKGITDIRAYLVFVKETNKEGEKDNVLHNEGKTDQHQNENGEGGRIRSLESDRNDFILDAIHYNILLSMNKTDELKKVPTADELNNVVREAMSKLDEKEKQEFEDKFIEAIVQQKYTQEEIPSVLADVYTLCAKKIEAKNKEIDKAKDEERTN